MAPDQRTSPGAQTRTVTIFCCSLALGDCGGAAVLRSMDSGRTVASGSSVGTRPGSGAAAHGCAFSKYGSKASIETFSVGSAAAPNKSRLSNTTV